jgi:hypothetical protein
MRTDLVKRITIIFAVTIAVGGIGAKVLYDKIVHGNDARNACERNLVWISGCKRIAAEEQGLKSGAIIDRSELSKYIVGDFPNCPAGGKYTIGPIGTGPTCSIPGHALPK